LQRLVADRLAELDRSYREAARQSGGLVSHGTLQKIATGQHSGRLNESTLRGIALAVDVPASVVREAAGTRADFGDFQLPERASKLRPKQRKALLAMMDALLDDLAGEERPRRSGPREG
jgi:membrane-bound lytic murein transglycosylase B